MSPRQVTLIVSFAFFFATVLLGGLLITAKDYGLAYMTFMTSLLILAIFDASLRE